MSSVDVIVPCYRYGHYLRTCVDSILLQTGPSVRVLIIDDASPDDSAEVAAALAEQDSRVSFLRHAQNKGHIATYNEGIDWAEGTYTLLLSADDYLLPEALERVADVMDAHPDVAFSFGKARALYGDGRVEDLLPGIDVFDRSSFCILSGREFIEASGARNCVPTPTAVVRTAHLKEAGGYRPELPHTGDMEMWWRMAAYGRVAYIGEALAVYRRHSTNMSLEYGTVSDLQHRQAAIDWFFRVCGQRFPNASEMSMQATQALGADALRLAHLTFQFGDVPASRELLSFAKEVYPPIRHSAGYLKASLKHRMGTKSYAKLSALLGANE